MHVCAYVCVHVPMPMRAHVCACVCVHVPMPMRAHVCVHTRVCACARACACVSMCPCLCMCVHVPVLVHVCACCVHMCGYNLCLFLAGQHACVRTINNFFSVDDLQYYTKPRGLEKVPKLDPSLVSPLYPLITTSNLHPVKVQRQVEQNS